MKGGTIYKQGNKWIWKSPPYTENGTQKRIRKSFDTEEQAIAQREIYYSILRGGEANNFIEGLTVRQAYQKWVDVAWQDNEEYITYNTQRGYANTYQKHILPYVGDLSLDNFNAKPLNLHLQELANRGKARKTLLNIKQAVIKLLRYAEKIGWIDVNNENSIIIPDTLKRQRERIVNVISQSEYEQVIAHMEKRCSQFAPVIRFLRYTGIRAEELCIKKSDISGQKLNISKAIKRKDFHKEGVKSSLTVSKYLKTDASYRTIPVSKEALKAITEALEWKQERGIESEYIFCTGTGALIEQRNILRAFHSACTAVGIEKRGLHSLRKLFCKTLKDLPLDWEQVRAVMGHETIEISQRYYYSIDSDDIDDIANKLSKNT